MSTIIAIIVCIIHTFSITQCQQLLFVLTPGAIPRSYTSSNKQDNSSLGQLRYVRVDMNRNCF
jgi:hypothetical protein